MRNNYRDAIRKAKLESWTKCFTEIEKGAEATRLDKLLSRNPEAILGALKLPNGAYSGTDEEILACLIGVHFRGFKRSGDGRGRHLGSIKNVRWTLKSLSAYKSPGPDGIYPVLLQRAGETVIGPLVRLARASLAVGHVPEAWRGTRVVFIPKAGKNGYTSPKDFRPISLTSFLLKTVERLVDKYIRDKVLSRRPLYKDQHAFRAGHSTETALSSVVNCCRMDLPHVGKQEFNGE